MNRTTYLGQPIRHTYQRGGASDYKKHCSNQRKRSGSQRLAGRRITCGKIKPESSDSKKLCRRENRLGGREEDKP